VCVACLVSGRHASIVHAHVEESGANRRVMASDRDAVSFRVSGVKGQRSLRARARQTADRARGPGVTAPSGSSPASIALPTTSDCDLPISMRCARTVSRALRSARDERAMSAFSSCAEWNVLAIAFLVGALLVMGRSERLGDCISGCVFAEVHCSATAPAGSRYGIVDRGLNCT
jgi:hypothetical protein